MYSTEFDVIVIGAGHAGCEAALACARLGLNTICFTLSLDSIAMMPCNPNIGGSSKGHLVREIDALGGEMGKNIDKTFIQSRMLNTSKGPAVHSLRAQADKRDYSQQMRHTMETQKNLTLRQAEVTELIIEDFVVKGVKIASGSVYYSKAVVITTGVYLNARCLCGEMITYTGPNGLPAATKLTDSLKSYGINILRFKTGTPARIDRKSIDFSKMEVQHGDVPIVPFSFSTDPDDIQKDQVDCYLTYTTEETHEIIRDNLDRSPMYSGVIQGTGPRYCPSIEDKVVKFPEKNRHQLFIEPEGLYTDEMYVSGMSSSMPEDVQWKMYRSVIGMENAVIVRNAYAIEYDLIDPMQLLPTLEFKNIKGLFSAGQSNGSSGYEEAAAQGILAGINAAMELLCRDQIILDRSQAYIGVLIDDLVTKETTEPYRMMTSRAEYRLLLRQDNADQRLTPIGHAVGLISDEVYGKLLEKIKLINNEIDRVNNVISGANKKVNEHLISLGSTPLSTGARLSDLIRRPECDYNNLSAIDVDRPVLPDDVCEQVNISIKYQGYLERQERQVAEFHKLEKKKIPENIDYDDIKGLRIEARQKLSKQRPVSLGQASRISGVSPADITVLNIYISSRALGNAD